MKIIFIVLVSFITLIAESPSKNSALNTISPTNSSKKSDYALQKSLDNWLKNDWEKKELHVEKNSTDFKLQDYVDKWVIYNRQKASEPKKASHVKMLNSLPVIGK